MEIRPLHTRMQLIARGLLVAAVVAVVVFTILIVPEWLVGFHGIDDQLPPIDRAKAISEERRSLLALLAATGAAAGLYYTHLRQQLDRDSNRTDRYTKAVEQTGNISPDVQLGGIYALERIAYDSVRDRGVVEEVLSAYVREHSRGRPAMPEVPDKNGRGEGRDNPDHDEIWRAERETKHEMPAAVKAAITVLGRRPRTDRTYPIADLSKANLQGLNFSESALEGAVLVETDLSNASLVAVSLRAANCRGAKLTSASFEDVDFTRAILTEIYAAGAIFSNCAFNGSNLDRAHLATAVPHGEDLSGVNHPGFDAHLLRWEGGIYAEQVRRADQGQGGP
ncbi:pentapeptide repeat protein, partial [Kribbella orskensis]